MKGNKRYHSGFNLAWLVVGCLALVLSRPATAQSIFASIVGTVTDATGAVVPNAKVTATNVNTNEKRLFQTDQAGNYEINSLFPGVYAVEVEAPGFTKERREAIKLASNDNARIDVTIEVARQVTGVTVLAEPPTRVETESSKLSDLRTLPQLRSLPVADESVYRYLALTPGVTGGVTTMSVSGSRQREVDFSVDGVVGSDIRTSSTVGPTFNYIEAFEELKIDTSNNSAEFKGLATLNVTTRRGGNELHAAIFDGYTSGATRAANPFSLTKADTPTHAFGTSASGPVYLPKLYDGRNKSFWFVSYQTDFAPASPNVYNTTVPPAVWEQGDFSRVTTVVRDPLNGQPFSGNIIPPTRISNVAKQYFRFWPLPNVGDLNSASGLNYNSLYMAPFAKPHNAQVRFDHHISQKNTIFGRYLFNRQYAPYPDGIDAYLGYGETIRRVRQPMVSDTQVFSATLINEFRFGASLDSLPWKNTLVNSTAFINAAGLTNVMRNGPVPDVPMIPVISFSSGAGIQSIDPTAYQPLGQSRTFQWQDTLSKITGKHSIRTGIEINWRQGNSQQQSDNLLGSYVFSNRYTGLNFADFLLGIPSTMSRSAYVPERDDRQVGYDFFVQDNYKITSRLTLNLGLRYDLLFGWTTSGMRMSAFDSTTGSIVVPDSALPLVSDLFPTNLVPIIGNSKTSFNDRLFPTDKKDFAPRVGLAWRPLPRQTLVVRGGYGIFYDIIPLQQPSFGPPFVVNEPAYTNPTNINDPGFVQWPLAYPKNIAATAAVSLPTYYASNFRTPYAQNWNVTIEKEVAQMVLRAAYVGTGAREMAIPFNINQPVPGPGLYINKTRPFPTLPAITEYINGASHNYNALNLEVERRMFKGLLYQSTFTIARDVGNDGVTPENTFDMVRERGMMQQLPHRRWVSFFVYDLPVGSGKRLGGSMPAGLNHLLGGWQLSAVGVLRDGQNETPLWLMPDIQGIAYTTSSTPPFVAYRPDCSGDPNYSHSQQALGAWYNVSVFSLPTTPGIFGTCGRGIIQGPAARVLHASLYKSFKVRERVTVRLGTQATNILNHTNYGNLSSSALRIDNTSSRATITTVYSSGSVGDAAGPRVLRLDVRISF